MGRIGVVFIAALLWVIYQSHMHARVRVEICQSHGVVYILKGSEISRFKSTFDIQDLKCDSREMSNSELQEMRRTYRRSSATVHER